MSCIQVGPVTVCGVGPKRALFRESRGIKWCFRCRKRVEFWFTVTDDVGPSYYYPYPSIDCEYGHNNGDLFPGWERMWDL